MKKFALNIIKHIFLITVICLLGGCNTVVQDKDGGVISSNSDNVKVTEKPNLTVVKHLADDTDSDKDKLKEAIACIKDKNTRRQSDYYLESRIISRQNIYLSSFVILYQELILLI